MEEEVFDIRQLLGVVRRQRKLIIATVILALALAAIVLFAITPEFRSSSLVLVDPSRKDLLDPGNGSGYSNTDSARVDSEVEMAHSDRVLVDVIRKENLVSDSEFGVKLGLKDKVLTLLRVGDTQLPTGEQAVLSVLRKLQQNVEVKRKGLTYLITVSVGSVDPNKAAHLANAITNTYIENQVQAKIDNTRMSRDVVAREVTQAQEAIIAADRAYEEFLNQNKKMILDEAGSDELRTVFENIETLSTIQMARQTTLENLNQDLQQENWDGILSELGSEAIQQLVQQRNTLERRLQTEDQEMAVDLRGELDRIDAQLRSEAQNSINALRSQVNSDTNELKTAKTNLDVALNQSNLPTEILAQIYGLRQTSNLATTQYRTLLARSKALDTELSLQVADSRVVSAAFPPSLPSYPNKKLVVLLALIAGLGVGFGLAFVYEFFIGGFLSEEQIEDTIKTPVAAVIGKENLPPQATSIADILVLSPLSRYSETMKRVQIAMHHSLRAPQRQSQEPKRCKVTLVTSTLPSEGKTTMALSLARSYAIAGQRTLIIDCDLRKPSLHKQLGQTTPKGIDDFLSGNLTKDILSSIVTTDEKSPLTAILGNRAVRRSTDQLVTKVALTRLIEIASQRFDHIIIDSPPVDPVVDALYLAEQADTIVYVIRWAKTSSRLVRKSVEMLKRVKREDTRIFAVLNQKEDNESNYYSNYSGYYREEDS